MLLSAVMTSSIAMLATVNAESTFGSAGASWWQTVGGLMAVFGLLMVSLKFLGKFNRRRGGGEANVLTVWHLGPKREIQVPRLGDEAHYIYRFENAMVLLKQEPLADFERTRAQATANDDAQGLKRFFPNGLPFPRMSAKCADPAPDLTSS